MGERDKKCDWNDRKRGEGNWRNERKYKAKVTKDRNETKKKKKFRNNDIPSKSEIDKKSRVELEWFIENEVIDGWFMKKN